ncbi:hypothetical protein SKAU_G00404510 [Synaphobranchus kaupii]|uniref:Uncharacterized protein n=1 Tax=Synaphobranchus kaupii TaxID=118154 RepID=A0A9Q1E9P6_SYNKA|nr:hypothetical protein SKAU_G00404510 [Synaphobranchus kaupii]
MDASNDGWRSSGRRRAALRDSLDDRVLCRTPARRFLRAKRAQKQTSQNTPPRAGTREPAATGPVSTDPGRAVKRRQIAKVNGKAAGKKGEDLAGARAFSTGPFVSRGARPELRASQAFKKATLVIKENHSRLPPHTAPSPVNENPRIPPVLLEQMSPRRLGLTDRPLASERRYVGGLWASDGLAVSPRPGQWREGPGGLKPSFCPTPVPNDGSTGQSVTRAGLRYVCNYAGNSPDGLGRPVGNLR